MVAQVSLQDSEPHENGEQLTFRRRSSPHHRTPRRGLARHCRLEFHMPGQRAASRRPFGSRRRRRRRSPDRHPCTRAVPYGSARDRNARALVGRDVAGFALAAARLAATDAVDAVARLAFLAGATGQAGGELGHAGVLRGAERGRHALVVDRAALHAFAPSAHVGLAAGRRGQTLTRTVTQETLSAAATALRVAAAHGVLRERATRTGAVAHAVGQAGCGKFGPCAHSSSGSLSAVTGSQMPSAPKPFFAAVHALQVPHAASQQMPSSQ
jgi:hypothetical protein